MTRYYTYKKDVPLGPGEHVDFTEGKGYYAAKDTPPPPPPVKQNPPPPSTPPPHGIQVPTGPQGPIGPAPPSNTNPPVVPPGTPPTIGVGSPGTKNTGPPPTGPKQPAPKPKGAPPHHGVLTYEEIVEVWELQGGDPAFSKLAALIALCESHGGHTDAINNTAHPNLPRYHKPGPNASPEFSVGLWQVNIVAHPRYTEDEMLDAYENASAIIAITGNGIHFGTTNVNCYKKAQGESAPTPTPPAVTPGSPAQETKASTSFHSAMVWLASDVPLRGKTLKSLGESMPAAIRSTLWPTST